nr:Chain A, Plasmid recombination enzyme [Streptococcus agalactiae]4LVJ_A Chain A, Plasmid recombination enzyme [Streptococcus agalactiae]4LVK_A Chain A, Plasmid recombination enzyme [Streptococcus agalactiae]4LVL_A Chain A, Plasmid recombination enzyme [Streptococcus agalactiae]4LVM_A Chain A, Plasmid recombination enzyme [Streptococcus agalactiae]4LVM_C Chain C, Plasmid recombination enzyme [Streptococcus agalactiae]
SYMVARMQKMKAGNLGGAFKHNERVFETHSNKDINPSRSHLNYELTDRDRSVSYEKQIKDYVNENKVSNRAIRKDAVLCDEWIITSDKDFFEKLDEEQTRTFFETAKNYFAENYGESNIAYASVHLDESTPHMHMGVVPFENGKLSSKAMFDREELKHIQEDLPRYMSDHGFELERGKLNSEAKHKTVAEFKRAMADM